MQKAFQTPLLTGDDATRLRDLFHEGRTVSVSRLPSSAQAALAWDLVRHLDRSLVWVTDGPAALESLMRDLETLAGDTKQRALLFPAREALAGEASAASRDIAGDRLRALQCCLHTDGPHLVATSVQALLQPVPSAKELDGRSLDLTLGSEHDLDHLIETLDTWGYAFEPEVIDKGQASMRGGILDVWPPSEDEPLRLEFFGAELDSLRTFDPSSQRSTGKRDAVTLLAATDRPEGKSALPLVHHLPPGTAWIWADPESLLHHAALYEESTIGLEGKAPVTTLQQVRQAVRRRFTGGELRCGPGFRGSSESMELDVHPVEGLPALTSGSLEMDLAEETRKQFVAGWLHRARQGAEVHIALYSEGTLERFREVYLQDRQDAKAVTLHLGPLSDGFVTAGGRFAVLTENDLYGRRKTLRGRYALHGKRRGKGRTGAGDRLIDWTDMQPGDYVVHLEHGIGRYLGLYEITFSGTKQEVLSLEYADKAKLHIPVSQAHLLSRYVGVGKKHPPLHVLGGTRWKKDKISAQRAVEDLAGSLLETQALREMLKGHAFATDTHWQHEFEATFPFEETPDQERAIGEVKTDMEGSKPMDRLLCGDVGYGKTEVAMRAAFKAVMGGMQVAVLVPTTVLAQQHFNSFSERMSAFPVQLAMLSRFRTRPEQQRAIEALKDGRVDIVIGTHRLLQADIAFKNLGLVIIDEEQRFGVKHKEHFKTLRNLVDVLTLSATPIPRTLYLSLTGARDMSTIQTAPRERLPIETKVVHNEDSLIRQAILREVNRGGQVFFLHNRVQTIQMVADRIRRLVPEARIDLGHGQMPQRDLSDVMRRFIDGAFDVLVCTTIIESGVDIPNVNTILIDRADRFGLSDLYQLRGRVGRYRNKAYAYLLLPPHLHGVGGARQRIQAIQKYSSLGAGFRIAMQDLEIRGAGNMLGSQQSGHIAAVGFDLYCQFLQRTIARRQGKEPPPIVEVDLDFDFLDLSPSSGYQDELAALPVEYMEDETMRVSFYRKLASAQTEEQLDELRESLRDRCGPLPPPAARLITATRIRLMAAARGIRKIEVRDDKIVLIDRRGNPMKHSTRFPRTQAKTPDLKMEDIARAVETWPVV